MPKRTKIDDYIATSIAEKKIDVHAFCMISDNAKFIEDAQEQNSPHKGKRYCDLCVDLISLQDDLLVTNTINYFITEMTSNKSNECKCRCIWSLYELLKDIPEGAGKNYMGFLAWIDQAKAPHHNHLSSYANFRNYLHRKGPGSCRFDYDLWFVEDFNLSPERLCKSDPIYTICFSKINNDLNKKLVKKYVYYMIVNGNMSISTISGALSYLIVCLNTSKKTYIEWQQGDVSTMLSTLALKCRKKKTIYAEFNALYLFTEWLAMNGFIVDSPITAFRDKIKNPAYEFKETAPDDYVIDQIFSKLDCVQDKRLFLCFLIIYSTGCRVSEAVTVKRDCLEKVNHGEKDLYYIRTYATKMKKDNITPISEQMYLHIKEYLESLTDDSVWLFESKKDPSQNMTVSTYTGNIKKTFMDAGIKNPDGTPYHYKSHSFRHYRAKIMHEAGIEIQYIAEELHHSNAEMTLAYIEFNDKKKLETMHTFYDIHGCEAPIETDVPLTTGEQYIMMLQEKINTQLLPNGVCGRPVKLSRCPHANTCLECDEFRTSVHFLDIHKQQLEQTEAVLVEARQNNWKPQIATNEIVEKNLKTIISTLESVTETKEKDHDDNDTDRTEISDTSDISIHH